MDPDHEATMRLVRQLAAAEAGEALETTSSGPGGNGGAQGVVANPPSLVRQLSRRELAEARLRHFGALAASPTETTVTTTTASTADAMEYVDATESDTDSDLEVIGCLPTEGTRGTKRPRDDGSDDDDDDGDLVDTGTITTASQRARLLNVASDSEECVVSEDEEDEQGAPDMAFFLVRLPRDRTSEDLTRGPGEIVPEWQFTGMMSFGIIFDLPWMFEAFPCMNKATTQVVFVVPPDADSGPTMDLLAKLKVHTRGRISHIKCPPLPAYGSHHCKLFLFFGPEWMRVVITTANNYSIDWEYNTQGVWYQDFPRDPLSSNAGDGSQFGGDLIDYLDSYERVGAKHAAWKREYGKKMYPWIMQVQQYDFSDARATLVASVPGTHVGDAMTQYGHMRLRALLLEQVSLDGGDANWHGPLAGITAECSSLGSLSPKYRRELETTMRAHSPRDVRTIGQRDPEMRIVVPSVDMVRNSVLGYRGGGCLPISRRNADRAQKLGVLSKYRADSLLRGRNPPHIKTYCRYDASQTRLAWVVMGSHNVSMSAWGTLEKSASQLRIRSYELSVLITPATAGKPLRIVPSHEASELRRRPDTLWVPLPHQVRAPPFPTLDVIPPPKNAPRVFHDPDTFDDVPWACDCAYMGADVIGDQNYVPS